MIKDYFADRIAKSVTPQTLTKTKRAIMEYIDRNSNILLTLDMSKLFSFADKDRKVIYDFIGVEENEIEKQIRLSKDIYNGNTVQNEPFYYATMLAVNRMLADGMKDDDCILILDYMSFMMYLSAHKGSFKYAPNKEIMDYTLSHLDKSFKIRSMPSIFAFIDDNTRVAYETYKARIVRGTDKDLCDVIDAFFTRIKGKVHKIAEAWYDNWKNGRYLNSDSDNFSEEDYHEMDNNSYAIERLASKVHLKLIDRRFDRRYLKYSISSRDVSLQKLSNLLEDILLGDEDNTVKKFISSIIEYYLLTSGKPFEYLGKGDFITYMKSAYGSNTTVAQMVLIKKILDMWVDEYMTTSGKNRYGKTAKAAYKKSLYMFFIFIINEEAKTR